MAGDELQLVDWLRTQQRVPDSIALGIGDDMAVIAPRGELICLSSDMLLDGVHFDSATQPLEAIGRKAIAASLSDCAAMAVRPIAATVSLALPKAMPLEDVKRLFAGMFAIAGQFDATIVGGDTTCWAHPLAIDVAIAASPYDGVDPITRRGAHVGDALFVTGPLGGSMRGGHLTFTPRVEEAKLAAQTLGVSLHAMMDISDGLSLDLWRLCEASNVGATLDEERLTHLISNDARQLAEEDDRPPLDHLLCDGEDFELLMAIDPTADVSTLSIHPIGSITERGLLLRRSDGKTTPIEPRGFVH